MLQKIMSVNVDARAREAGPTGREREVINLVMLGRSTSEITTALRIAASTAKFHQANAQRKLEASPRGELSRSLAHRSFAGGSRGNEGESRGRA